jgi:hypothetical protein
MLPASCPNGDVHGKLRAIATGSRAEAARQSRRAAFLSQQQHAAPWQKQRSPDTRRSVLKVIKRGKTIAEATRLVDG